MTETPKPKPFFVAFEGGEGAGKTTQARLLQERLQTLSRSVLLTREPGGTDLGEHLRQIILRPTNDRRESKPEPHLTAAAELFLFLAARAQLVDEVIRPALAGGAVVICDRFSDSTIAYQGYGRGLDLEAVRKACDLATTAFDPTSPSSSTCPSRPAWPARRNGRARRHRPGKPRLPRARAAGLPRPRRRRAAAVARRRRVPAFEEVARLIWERVRRLLNEDRP